MITNQVNWLRFRIADRNGGYQLRRYNCELSDVSISDSIRYEVNSVEDSDYDLYSRSSFSSCDRQDYGNTKKKKTNKLKWIN